MAKTINVNIGDSMTKFTFTDSDGDVIASFKMNIADVRIVSKCQEIASAFNEQSKIPRDCSNADAMAQLDKLLEDKFCYLLGYDCRSSLFGMMSATTIMADGDMFAVKVLDKIAETVGTELQKRKAVRDAAVAKHTAKYNT